MGKPDYFSKEYPAVDADQIPLANRALENQETNGLGINQLAWQICGDSSPEIHLGLSFRISEIVAKLGIKPDKGGVFTSKQIELIKANLES